MLMVTNVLQVLLTDVISAIRIKTTNTLIVMVIHTGLKMIHTYTCYVKAVIKIIICILQKVTGLRLISLIQMENGLIYVAVIMFLVII